MAMMRDFEFDLALSSDRIETLYSGQARYVLVETVQGLKLQLPASNFRQFVSGEGIRGRFRVKIDQNNKIQQLEML